MNNSELYNKIDALSENKAKRALKTLAMSSFISNDDLFRIIEDAELGIADNVRVTS